MKTEYRVLLIDDTLEVLENLRAFIYQNQPIIIESTSQTIIAVTVKVEILHVRLTQVHGGNDYEITNDTINELALTCDKEFDFIFSDFAFIGDRNKNEILRTNLLAEKRSVCSKDLKGWVLHINDFKAKIKMLEISNPIMFNKLRCNFLDNKNIIQIYTNSPEPFSSYFEGIELPKRIDEVKKTFLNSKKIEFILMHNEFSITSQIDNLFNEDDRKKYYAKLLSSRLKSQIETVILRYMVTEQRKYKLRDSLSAYKAITVIGLIIGIISALCGEVLAHFLHNFLSDVWILLGVHFPETTFGKLTTFIVLLFATSIILIISAIFSEKILEKFAKNHTGE